MRLSRSSRSIVALLTAAFLLLCQTAMAANACFMSSAQPDKALESITMPCHTAAADSAPAQQPAASSSCDAAQALSKTPDVSAFPPAALPPLLVAIYDPALVLRSFSGVHGAAAVCSSPAFTVLHCRFLI